MSAAAVPEPSPALVAARAFAARGWRPFPVEYGGKRPAVGIKWGTATAIEPNDGMLELWFGRAPVNVGIAAKGSRLVVLDEDHLGAMERLCEAYGQPIPDTYRVRTAKGWHWYFEASLGVTIGNAAGLLSDFGFDVRGGKGDGGYVVAAGSVHESGHVYEAEDDAADVAPMPEWIEILLAAGSDDAERAESDAEHAESDRERRYTMDQAVAWVTRYAIEPLKAATPGGRNIALNTAAIVVGHFLPAFWSREWAVERLTELARELELDESEILPTIRSGMRAGTADPYTLVESPDPFEAASSGAGAAEAEYEHEIAIELNRLKVREEARRRLATERNAHRPRIADGMVDDLDAIEAPAMLLGELIPDGAVGFLAGRSGAYKSFLATSWACCIATGRAWLGRREFAVTRPLRTLYVAAEGAAGAAGRIKAWEAATGASRRGKLLVYPRPIHLNDPAQVDELAAYVAEHGFEFVVIDTYHRAAPGVDENDATEFGTVFAAAARLRDDHGCGVLFVDHTGHSGDGRPRGSSAKGDDADYVLSASYGGLTRGPDVQRTLTVIKLKDEESGADWPIRLARVVDGQRFPVVEIGTVEVSTPFESGDGAEWWMIELAPELVELVNTKDAGQKNAGRHAALDIVRVLTLADGDHDGLTGGEIRRLLNDKATPRKHSTPSITAGLALLKKRNVAVNNGSTQRLQLAQRWRPNA